MTTTSVSSMPGRSNEAIGDERPRPLETNVRAIGDLVDEALTTIENRFAGGHPHGVQTGFQDLDELLGELQPGSLTVLAGPPAVGKTSTALAVAISNSRESTAVLFATNELSAQVIAARLLASEAAVDGVRVRDGRLRERDWQEIGRAVDAVDEMACS
jgi:replicative DNA helicase